MSDFLKSIVHFLGPELVSMWAFDAGWSDAHIAKFLELLEFGPADVDLNPGGRFAPPPEAVEALVKADAMPELAAPE